MFAHFATLFTLFFVFPFLASAIAIEARIRGAVGSINQCDTGTIHCCNSVQAADSSRISALADFFGFPVSDAIRQVGLNCSPVSVAGAGGNSCTAQPVCCTGNSFNGLFVLGCHPMDIKT